MYFSLHFVFGLHYRVFFRIDVATTILILNCASPPKLPPLVNFVFPLQPCHIHLFRLPLQHFPPPNVVTTFNCCPPSNVKICSPLFNHCPLETFACAADLWSFLSVSESSDLACPGCVAGPKNGARLGWRSGAPKCGPERFARRAL